MPSRLRATVRRRARSTRLPLICLCAVSIQHTAPSEISISLNGLLGFGLSVKKSPPDSAIDIRINIKWTCLFKGQNNSSRLYVSRLLYHWYMCTLLVLALFIHLVMFRRQMCGRCWIFGTNLST